MHKARPPAPSRSIPTEPDTASAGPAARERADRLLVARGLFESRSRAAAAIEAGTVFADGRLVARPSDLLSPEAAIEAAPAHPWVSRGGVKLAFALDHFGYAPAGLTCLDVGASTGGFTDVLLARKARLVIAVDTGHGQLHASLRAHPAVRNREGTDIRTLQAAALDAPIQGIVIDASFISLHLILSAALRLATAPAFAVALIKPQFEAGRAALKKGIVRDPQIHQAVCDDIAGAVAGLGWHVDGVIPSPIAGGDGNVEFLLGARLA